MNIKTIELKKIKVFEAMSEETNCYVGTVYINGKPAIDVKNDGHGGCDMQYPINGNDRSIIDAANEYCKQNFPATVFLFGNTTKDNIKQKDIMYSCLETWCGDQLQNHAVQKEVKRLTAKKVSFVKDGEIYSIPKGQHPEQAIVLHIQAKYGKVPILNTLSPDEQVKAILLLHADRIESKKVQMSYEEAIKIAA